MELTPEQIQELISDNDRLSKENKALNSKLQSTEQALKEQKQTTSRHESQLQDLLKDDIASDIYEGEISRLQELARDSYLKGLYLQTGADPSPEAFELFRSRYSNLVSLNGESIGIAGYPDGEAAFLKDFKSKPINQRLFYGDEAVSSDPSRIASKGVAVTEADLLNSVDFQRRTGLNLADPDLWESGKLQMTRSNGDRQIPKGAKTVTMDQLGDWQYLKSQNISLEDIESGAVKVVQ